MDEVLKSEIEQAASESRHLADELAGMLDRLEIEEDRSAAVNAAVLGEQEEVEAALKVMIEPIPIFLLSIRLISIHMLTQFQGDG